MFACICTQAASEQRRHKLSYTIAHDTREAAGAAKAQSLAAALRVGEAEGKGGDGTEGEEAGEGKGCMTSAWRAGWQRKEG